MKHKNVGLKAKLRAAQPVVVPPATAPTHRLENAEEVEKILSLRRERQAPAVRPPPDRSGLIGELRHPGIPGFITGWLEIDKARAEAWLKYNVLNRKLNKAKVGSFARQHAKGDFVATHQGIAFDDADNLVDGQHTLEMIILTDRPVMRMVTFGIPRKPAGKDFHTIDVIDAGGRSVADQLRISHGITESGPKKQICIALASLCFGARTRALSVGQTLKVLKAFECSIQFVINNRAKSTGLRQIGVLAAFAFALASAHDSGLVEKLYIELTSGRDLMDESTLKKRQKDGLAMRPIELLYHFLTGPDNVFFNKSMNRCIAEITLQVIYGECHKVKIKELEQGEVGLKWFAGKQKDRVAKIADLFRLPEENL